MFSLIVYQNHYFHALMMNSFGRNIVALIWTSIAMAQDTIGNMTVKKYIP